ncbi:MAG: endoglucanase [Gaiellaceae bacterium]|nr:endoglucanase [Gaiellaceae bacterium]
MPSLTAQALRRAAIFLGLALLLACALSAPASARSATPLAARGGTSAADPLAGVQFWREGPRRGLAAGQIARWLGWRHPEYSAPAGGFDDDVTWERFAAMVPDLELDALEHAHEINLMMKVASQPETKRFGGWNSAGEVHDQVLRLVQRVEDYSPGQVPVLAVYRLKHVRCGRQADSRGEQAAYRHWIADFASAIGHHEAVIFLEQDALITTGCLSHRGLAIRMAELRYATGRLGALPHAVTYLDAGAADAVPAGRISRMLRQSGVASIQGFFLNSTHFDWTSSEISYGKRLSRSLRGKHFVVNTAVNGQGPLRPRSRVRHGNEVLCNPPGRGLGIRPTTKTPSRVIDAFMWIGDVGRSGGRCGASQLGTGAFDASLALGLASRADERLGPGSPSIPY